MDMFNSADFLDGSDEQAAGAGDQEQDIIDAFYAMDEDPSPGGSEGSAMRVDMPVWVLTGVLPEDDTPSSSPAASPQRAHMVPYFGMAFVHLVDEPSF